MDTESKEILLEMQKLQKQQNDMIQNIEENTKKPHWFRVFASFMFLSIGLLFFNLLGTKIANNVLKIFNFSDFQILLSANLLILLSLFLYRR